MCAHLEAFSVAQIQFILACSPVLIFEHNKGPCESTVLSEALLNEEVSCPHCMILICLQRMRFVCCNVVL